MKSKQYLCNKVNILEILESMINSNPSLYTNEVYEKLQEIINLINNKKPYERQR
ncbi:MAG: hypothetical protein RIQ57_377 [Pseudomonadota bacterium]|jgi:hypothetical protein